MNTQGNIRVFSSIACFRFLCSQKQPREQQLRKQFLFVLKMAFFAHYSINRDDRLAFPPFQISLIHGDREWVNSEGVKFIVKHKSIIRTRKQDDGRYVKSNAHSFSF